MLDLGWVRSTGGILYSTGVVVVKGVSSCVLRIAWVEAPGESLIGSIGLLVGGDGVFLAG